jgi:hypothetical protein
VDYLEYKRVTETALGALRLPPDCSVGDYIFMRAGISVQAWSFEWIVKFADRKYLRVWEEYGRVPGLQESRRTRFSFHYGPVPDGYVDGEIQYAHDDPVCIRIDNHCSSAHLHLHDPLPHYKQSEVIGLSLVDLTMLSFVKSILKHRRNGISIKRVLNLRIKQRN